jgi:hypothetical protein
MGGFCLKAPLNTPLAQNPIQWPAGQFHGIMKRFEKADLRAG